MRPFPNFLPALLLAALPLSAEPEGDFRASLEEGKRLSLLLRLESGPSRALIGLEADSSGLLLASGLELVKAEGQLFPARLVAGPGSTAGPLSVLSRPTAYSPSLSALGLPLDLDPSLGSGTAVLGLDLGGPPSPPGWRLSLFGAAQGLEEGFLLFREGLGSEGVEEKVPPLFPEALAIGAALSLALGPEAGGSGLAFLASYALRRSEGGSGGWELESRALPADSGLFAALVLERRGGRAGAAWGSARWALAAEAFPHEAPALATRLEAEAGAGPLSLRARAGAAGPGFRPLLGGEPERLAGLALDFRLALRRSAAASLSFRAELASLEARPPGFETALSLGLELPLGSAGLLLRPSLAFEGGEPSALTLGLKGKREALSFSLEGGLDIEVEAERATVEGRASGGLVFEPSSPLEPAVEARLSLEGLPLGGGGPEAAVADAGLRLEWALPRAASLGVGLSIERGSLSPVDAGDEPDAVELSVFYSQALGRAQPTQRPYSLRLP